MKQVTFILIALSMINKTMMNRTKQCAINYKLGDGNLKNEMILFSERQLEIWKRVKHIISTFSAVIFSKTLTVILLLMLHT